MEVAYVQRLLLSYCCDFLGRIIYDVALDGYLDTVALGIKDNTFIVPVAGGSGLPYNGNSVCGHFFGQEVHLFFWTDGEWDVCYSKMFHVEHWLCQSPNIRIIHHFQASAVFEGDESAGELFCGIVIKGLNISTEILPVEFTDFVDIFYPDGDVLYFHNKPTIIYIK